MKVLIIGGSQFSGRHLTECALSAGHEVTLFNRGRINPALFPEIERIQGHRLGDIWKLNGRRWEAVIDTCGYTSQQVRASAKVLADLVEHYSFVSSLSVYSDFSRAGLDESGPVEQLTEGQEEDKRDLTTYGARKVRCEQGLEALLPGRVFVIRAGVIVGPYDYMDRFPYWVRRIAKGGEVLVPGNPDRPVQLIDVRDLAQWIVRMVEMHQAGTFNATGPDYKLTMGTMLEKCREVSNPSTKITWVDDQFLLQQGVTPWSELPFWLPGEGAQGFFSIDVQKAIRAGLVFRPLEETIKDTLEWDATRTELNQPSDRPVVIAQGKAGLTPEREVELLEIWHKNHQ
jgi:2'-hydroxyisoflavone reductase